ncbi:MAG: hypothetical protein LAN18_04935 [Acidobacteriia bacterium]|nr:hypothetical protein [Terriglobia bacterium]
MKMPVITLILLLTASPAFAKPATKTFPASCERVWQVVESIPTGPGHPYSSSMLDDKRLKAEFVTGHGAWTGKRTLYLTLSGTGDTCEVAVEGIFSGLAHNDKGDLFKRIEQALVETPSKPAPEVKK